MSLTVALIPFSLDNYIFFFEDPTTKLTCAVDPGSSQALVEYLTHNNKQLDFILNTHHHHDHIGGNLELKSKYNCTIIGNANDAQRLPGIDIQVKEGDTVNIGETGFSIISVDGHTIGHIAYYNEENHLLFCGDTLFSVGCGRLFEGTPKQMLESLNKLKVLPDQTKIYCAHEYTLANIDFALTLEPNNKALKSYKQIAEKLRQNHKPTIPTDIKTQKQVNPFLRPDSKEIKHTLFMEASNPLETFTKTRQLKDRF